MNSSFDEINGYITRTTTTPDYYTISEGRFHFPGQGVLRNFLERTDKQYKIDTNICKPMSIFVTINEWPNGLKNLLRSIPLENKIHVITKRQLRVLEKWL